MLDYSEYQSLLDILDKSELDNTYTDLIKKEESVLDTINAVVNNIQDKSYEKKQFIHISLYELYTFLFLEIPRIGIELGTATSFKDLMIIIFKGYRIIYIGMLLVMISFFLFFYNNSK